MGNAVELDVRLPPAHNIQDVVVVVFLNLEDVETAFVIEGGSMLPAQVLLDVSNPSKGEFVAPPVLTRISFPERTCKKDRAGGGPPLAHRI